MGGLLSSVTKEILYPVESVWFESGLAKMTGGLASTRTAQNTFNQIEQSTRETEC